MDNHDLRQKVIELSELGAIKQKRKFLEKAYHEALRAIWDKHEADQLKEVNELATETILKQTSNILCWFNIVKKKYETDLAEDLESNKLLRKDIEKIVSIVTPYLPYVGLATGGLTFGRYAAQSHITKEEEQDTNTPPQQNNDPSPQEDEQKEWGTTLLHGTYSFFIHKG